MQEESKLLIQLILTSLIILSHFVTANNNNNNNNNNHNNVSDENILPTLDGYYIDTLNEVAKVTTAETLECPSSNVITTHYKCNVNGKWIDCTRRHCCKDYIFIGGKCISKDQDPCKMGLCEQYCTVFLQRVICTCFDGYKFSPENQKNGIKPVCIDINECLDNNGDCEHRCINEIGSYRCSCHKGYVLHNDNRTCGLETINRDTANAQPLENEQPAIATENLGQVQASHLHRCYASCDSLVRLDGKLKSLQEKVSALSTAIRLSSFASGPPGPIGPPGPPGIPGPRGFPGPESVSQSSYHDHTYSMLDTFVPVPDNPNVHCQCKRGAQGETGPRGLQGQKGEQGEQGLRGPKGDRGSFDFLLLMLADMRHDIVHLQNKVFPKEKPPKFDFEGALSKKKLKQKHRILHNQKALEAFAKPVDEFQNSQHYKTTELNNSNKDKIYKGTTLREDASNEENIEEFVDANLSKFVEQIDNDNYDESSGESMSYEDYF